MKIVKDRPPNFEAIRAVFPLASGEGVIFAYGDTIFVPSGAELPPELVAHEEAHGVRQIAMGVEAWWDRYLVDLDFRYEEELIAHRAEYQKLCETAPSRNQRRYLLRHVAKKLAAPLYGRMISELKARKDILNDDTD